MAEIDYSEPFKIKSISLGVSKPASGARKDDGGKSPMWRGLMNYFPRALSAVADVSGFGSKKYAWGGWAHVPDGLNRYNDAMLRHLAAEARGETVDPESGLLHAAHAAWGALARLEKILRDREDVAQAEYPGQAIETDAAEVVEELMRRAG